MRKRTKRPNRLWGRRQGLLIACLVACCLPASAHEFGHSADTSADGRAEQREPGRGHTADEFHIHADLLVVIDGQRLDLSQSRYQSDDFRQLDPDLHLHNGDGDVLHIHAPERTLAQFFAALGMRLTDHALLAEGVNDAGDDTRQLTLLANGQPVTADYRMADLDRILVVYGNSDARRISALMAEVSDRACIYSGSCPHRGSPPPEGCGSAEGGCPPPWIE